MTRKGFHIFLAFVLFFCAVSPFIEFTVRWDRSIFQTGYDGESTVAIIALVLILAFAVAKVLASFVPERITEEPLFDPKETAHLNVGFTTSSPDTSPPLALRI